MELKISRNESVLGIAGLALVAGACMAPPLVQWASPHAFADQRTAWGLDCTLDVLSNLPFLFAGAAGLALLLRVPARRLSTMLRAMAALFCGGLGVLGLASAGYHLDPGRDALALYRAAMVLAGSGLLGLAAVAHVSERAGAVLGLGSLAAGLAAVQAGMDTGNVLPWAVYQCGGLVLLGWMAGHQLQPRTMRVDWLPVLLACAAAVLCGSHDALVFMLTEGLVSGHTLGHAFGALAALPVLGGLWRAGSRRRPVPAHAGHSGWVLR